MVFKPYSEITDAIIIQETFDPFFKKFGGFFSETFLTKNTSTHMFTLSTLDSG